MRLRPYQEETVAAAIEPKSAIWRRLLVLATGAGKTVISAEILNRLLKPGQSALFIAHREELLTQAKAEIEGFVPDLHVELEQAGNRATRERGFFDRHRRHVVVGSVQTLRKARLKSWAEDSFALIVIDEAHHAAAKSYVDIVKHFGCHSHEQKTPLIGVTATPMRSDGIGLDGVFQEISATHGIGDLVEQGYLCDLTALSVNTKTDLRGIKITAGDFNVRDLERVVNDEERNSLIVAAHRKFALNRPTIVFAAGVGHAQLLAEMFCSAGVKAEAMWGAMGDDERKASLARYASGKTQVLTHFNLLTEGFNAPQTSCIILGRPTKSSLVMTQAIGRGTRLHPGKENCLVIDVRDVTSGKNLFTAASLAGLPANFNLSGKSMFDEKKKHDELSKKAPHLADKALTPEDVERALAHVAAQMHAREVQLLRRRRIEPPQNGEYKSPFLWFRRSKNFYEVSPDKGQAVYRVFSDGEKWYAVSRWKQGAERLLGEATSVHEAVFIADSEIAKKHKNTALIERNAPWALEPPSSKQVHLLSKRGIPVDERVTKGEATRLLNGIFAGAVA